jgi:2-methylisocitrate lyase-like PEP mutase family enzyme
VEGIAAALERAEAYLEAGADLIFVEGPPTLGDTERVGAQFGARVPLVHNLVEGGVTATKSGADLEAMGFAVALHPLLLLHGFAARAPGWLTHLRDERSTERLEPEIATLQQMNVIVGAGALIADGARYGEMDQ